MTTLMWKRWILPLALFAAHTLVVEIATTIELNDAWNDQNATMLVMVALPVVDAPVFWVLEPLIGWQDNPGLFLLGLKYLGGAFWFAVGWVAASVWIALQNNSAPPTAGRATTSS